jgi:hypothetical protein
MAACGIHHANRLVRGRRNQSRELSTLSVATPNQPVQQEAALSPARSAWIGGHGIEPYEQNTQQSPAFGLSRTPQPVHS